MKTKKRVSLFFFGRKIFKRSFTILLLLTALHINAQQIHVNREWRSETGDPVFNPLLTYGGDWTKSVVTATNDLITVGHTSVSGQGENILISRYDQYGSMLWQTDFNSGSSFNDYAVDVMEASTGDIFICGTTDNGGTTNYDVIILVLNSGGTLQYSTTYNANSLNDIPGAIKEDTYGNLVIAATSESTTTGYNYLLLNFTPTLSLNWSNTYDYASLTDVPVGLEIGGGTIYVAGASASSVTTWDYAVAEFNEVTGAYNGDWRDNLPGIGYDQPLSFKKDASGNTYITGKASSDGINYDIRTAKITSANTIAWIQSYDAFGLNDVGNTIAIDGNGDVIVGGYITKSNNVKDYIIIKYDGSSGSLLWQQTQTSKDNTADAFIKAISLNNTNDIYFIGGEKAIGSNKQAIVGKISSDGNKKWERPIKGNYDYLPSDIQFGGYGVPGVYAIAIKDSTVNAYEMSYFTEFQRDTTNVYGSNGPLFKKSEILIRFNKNMMNLNKTDNTDITYGTLAEFLDSTGLSNFNGYMKTTTDEYKVFKIYPNLASKDSLSLSRTGNTVKLLPFYAALGVIFPSYTDDTTTVKDLRNAFGLVEAADINYYLELSNTKQKTNYIPKAEEASSTTTLNDPDYTNGNSAGLDAMGSYTNANINATSAWNISTGSPSIIVGVYDSGINKSHQDFNASSLPNSKISDGYDYINGAPLYNIAPFDRLGHGTGIAGIIGAIRNNGVAVAGIAGGDASLNQTGVTLHDMKLFEGNTVNTNCNIISYNALISTMSNAIVDGAISSASANIGLAQHAQNLSWGMPSNNPMIQNDVQFIKDALKTSFINEVLVSFASGNNENPSFTSGIWNQPTRFKDEWCLTVGANNESNLRANFSCGSKYLDFVAPGTVALYNLLDKSSVSTTTDNIYYGSTGACTVVANGTSFSNPHAVGLAALMMSHVNTHPNKINNIAPEDIEQLIQKNITDITTYSVGYDPETGHGRINAGATMSKIKIPDYYVQHVNVVTSLSNCTTVQTGTLENVWFPYNWQTYIGGTNGVVNKYEISYTSSHNINGYNLIDYWKRDATSNLMGDVTSPTAGPGGDNDMPSEPSVTVVSCNSSAAVMKGYTYELMDWDNVNMTYTSSGIWYPFNISNGSQQIKFGYSLHTAVVNVGKKENLDEKFELSVYPNPSDDSFTILLNSNKRIDTEVNIYDVAGKLILKANKAFDSAGSSYSMSTKYLPSGIYFVNLKGNDGLNKTFKQIVTH